MASIGIMTTYTPFNIYGVIYRVVNDYQKGTHIPQKIIGDNFVNIAPRRSTLSEAIKDIEKDSGTKM